MAVSASFRTRPRTASPCSFPRILQQSADPLHHRAEGERPPTWSNGNHLNIEVSALPPGVVPSGTYRPSHTERAAFREGTSLNVSITEATAGHHRHRWRWCGADLSANNIHLAHRITFSPFPCSPRAVHAPQTPSLDPATQSDFWLGAWRTSPGPMAGMAPTRYDQGTRWQGDPRTLRGPGYQVLGRCKLERVGPAEQEVETDLGGQPGGLHDLRGRHGGRPHGTEPARAGRGNRSAVSAGAWSSSISRPIPWTGNGNAAPTKAQHGK